MVGWYVDGVFSYMVDQDLTPERKARVGGWTVSLVASLDRDVSNMVRNFTWIAAVGRFALKLGGTLSMCSATTGLHAFRNLPHRNDGTVSSKFATCVCSR